MAVFKVKILFDYFDGLIRVASIVLKFLLFNIGGLERRGGRGLSIQIGHMMDNIDLRESDLVVDLESGGTTSDEDGCKDLVSGHRQLKKLLRGTWSGFEGLDGSIRLGDGVGSQNKVLNSGETSVQNVEIVLDNLGVEYMEKKPVKEKRKKVNSKRPPKPPRPPRGTSLDAADMKLVREISELATLKRARVERMKALKKMRADKASSSNSNLFAMIITILFCFIIIYQGFLGSRI